MHLVMFDVDGTLVIGNGIDDVCFSEAVKDVLGIQQIDTDWSRYLNVTDSGITSEIIEKNLLRRAEEYDIRAVRHSYLTRLKHEIEKNPRSFQLIPGASELIASLRSRESVCMCIATGGWRDATLLKLGALGISTENIPIASSDDSPERESIMLLAHERARVHMNCEAFNSVLYVADHPWDYINSKKLGYGFVGIGSGEHELELRRAGAIHVLPNFTDKDYFLRVLGMTKH
jgi:phosphoglycolate phosphatase-like HAD superfamily hydrolase